MNEWKFQQRLKKRGDWCLMNGIKLDGTPYGCLCGCGLRNLPTKKYKTRIIKRELQNQLRDEIKENDLIF